MFLKTQHLMVGLCLLEFLAIANPLAAQERLHVVIDVFSGMPNPDFLLDVGEGAGGGDSARIYAEKLLAQRILEKCRGAAGSSAERQPYPRRLGYKGILISRQIGQATYQPLAAIYQGNLLCTDAVSKASTHHRDENSALEKALLSLALETNEIPEPLFNSILQVFDKRASGGKR
jgi:hypothetical protein